jgi:cytochrome c556
MDGRAEFPRPFISPSDNPLLNCGAGRHQSNPEGIRGMKRFVKLGLLAVCAVAATTVIAQDKPTPEQVAVKARQGLLEATSFNMGPLGGMLKNQVPFDAAVAQKNATRIAQLGAMIPDFFSTDTRKATNVTTKAREGIWAQKADFDAKANDLVKAATEAADAAKGGDKTATLKALGAVGKACGSCHDSFRDK